MADFGGTLRWQTGYSLWRLELFKRKYGQRKTEVWLGHVYACWPWPFGFWK
jgi:hypothetical protein